MKILRHLLEFLDPFDQALLLPYVREKLAARTDPHLHNHDTLLLDLYHHSNKKYPYIIIRTLIIN